MLSARAVQQRLSDIAKRSLRRLGGWCEISPYGEVALRDYAVHHLPASDREPFVELAEREIERLHEGTIARYRLRPSEYDAWQRRRLYLR